jgi:predicted methyltransferase MtxX (methanogen marker protein 4)
MAETCRSNVYRRTSAMRFLYGPVKIEEGWKIRNNDELEEVMRGEDTVKFIRAQRIKLWVYLNSKIKK